MARRKAPAWTSAEVAILREHYPDGGLNAVADLLPERTWSAIHVMASKIGVRSTATNDAPKPKLQGALLEQAITLRERDGWSFARIGASLGVCESSATNAILMALCVRDGHRPAERDKRGRLTEAGRDRLRLMLKKGLKGVEIQRRLAVSAACVAEQRRRYNADLKERGKAPLLPPGGGEAYSGAKVPKEKLKAAEALFLDGWGTAKVSAQTGVSKTVCTRLRDRLVKRLRRKGEVLPGCDTNGTRRVVRGSARAVPDDAVERLKAMILDRVPVARAARQLGIGSCTAYRIRDAMKAELGDALPAPRRPGRVRGLARELLHDRDIPAAQLRRFRALTHEHGVDEARRLLKAEMAEAKRGRSFEDQLAAVAAGAAVVRVIPIRKADPQGTLGGIATAAIQ